MNKKVGLIILGIILCIIAFFIYNGNNEKNQNSPAIKQNAKNSYQKITGNELKQELDNGNNLIILDVRSEAEYNEKHIKGSTLIPIDELNNRAVNEITDKNIKIIVYCRSGNRSKSASNILLELGYTNVYDLGSISNWEYETE